METDVFTRLREQLDQYAFGYPTTESGVEMEILKLMFTEEEAIMFTQLTAELETPSIVAKRIGVPIQMVADRLEDMAKKGLLFRRRVDDIVEYGTIPFLHGLYEFQITRLGKQLVKLAGQYINESYKNNMAQGMRSFIRTIPVEGSVKIVHHVAIYDDAREILKNANLIVVTECSCRQGKSLFKKDCGRPREVCFMFGPIGQYYIDNGMGRQIDITEAFQILDVAQKAGLIIQPSTSQNPFVMCNCCVCCCGFLQVVSKHANPAELVFSNYQIGVDRSKCIGCGICIDRCGMDAIKMSDHDGLSELNVHRCIGCGLCVTTCPTNARSLLPKQSEPSIPYADTAEQFIQIVKNRGIEDVSISNAFSFGFERKG